mmetsp:Transcript_60181/g.189022  ORF Transcript_60181/g.189022 Transcript_60181/m.189022 type:complete len:303 (-) Transcript_60181:37-945(-)
MRQRSGVKKGRAQRPGGPMRPAGSEATRTAVFSRIRTTRARVARGGGSGTAASGTGTALPSVSAHSGANLHQRARSLTACSLPSPPSPSAPCCARERPSSARCRPSLTALWSCRAADLAACVTNVYKPGLRSQPRYGALQTGQWGSSRRGSRRWQRTQASTQAAWTPAMVPRQRHGRTRGPPDSRQIQHSAGASPPLPEAAEGIERLPASQTRPPGSTVNDLSRRRSSCGVVCCDKLSSPVSPLLPGVSGELLQPLRLVSPPGLQPRKSLSPSAADRRRGDSIWLSPGTPLARTRRAGSPHP